MYVITNIFYVNYLTRIFTLKITYSIIGSFLKLKTLKLALKLNKILQGYIKQLECLRF